MGDLRISRHPRPPADGLVYETSERWVRGVVADQVVIDSRAPLLLWEPGLGVPRYLFPEADVRADLLAPAGAADGDPHPGASAWYDLVVAGRRLPRLAWRYDTGALAGHYGFDWFRRQEPGIEHWFEEDEEIFVHPRDPYHRVDPITSTRHVQVALGGRVVADTKRPVLLFETGLPTRYYIPPEDVDFSSLDESALQTRCPYKGLARYWTVRDQPFGTDVVWAYDDPIGPALPIRRHLAFYNEAVDITVDGVGLERPVTAFSKRLASR